MEKLACQVIISGSSGEYITKFAAGGPKNYTYQTNHNTTICKIRGFTLNYENSLMVNFDTMVELILETLENNQTKPGIVTRNPSKIYRNKKTYSISSRYEEKLYSMKYSKRVRVPGTFDSVPYGYKW